MHLMPGVFFVNKLREDGVLPCELKNITMTKLLFPIFAILFGLTFSAQAQHYNNSRNACSTSYPSVTYVSGHSSCGCPRYTKKVTVGRDHRGYSIYKYYSVPFSCGCKKYQQPRHNSSYSHGRSSYYSRSNYNNQRHSSSYYRQRSRNGNCSSQFTYRR